MVLAGPPAAEVNRKPSTYAPAKDLERQMVFFMDRIQEDLEDESKFDARAKRVVRDANTIAVVALVLGKHDDKNGLQLPAAAVIDAASELARKSNHADAKSAYEALVAAAQSRGGAAALEWRSVGDIEQIMLQVPQLNTSLRGAVRSKRFPELRDKAAGLAATLAAIAQVSMFDKSYCADDADHAEWAELCALMRDASTDVYAAVERGDQEAAEKALKPLVRTCDDCHDQFKD